MSQKLRLPDISGATDKEKLQQIKSYLHQTVSQLNWILDTLSAPNGAEESAVSLYSRLRPYLLSSGELARSMANKLQGAFVPISALPAAFHVAFYKAGTEGITLQSRFSSLDENSDKRQIFFLFGTLGGQPVWETITLFQDGTLYHQNQLSATVDDQGQIHLSVMEADCLLVLTYLED